MGSSAIAGLIATFVVGGAVGTATLVGVVNSQTAAPEKSPASISQNEDGTAAYDEYIPY